MPQASSTIRHNIEIFHLMLSNLMFSQSVWCSAELIDVTLHHLWVRCTIRHYAEPFYAMLHRLCVRCVIRHYPESFHRLYVRCAIRHRATLSHATLHRMPVHCTIRHYTEPFDALYLLRYLTSLYFWWRRPPLPIEIWSFQTSIRLLVVLSVHRPRALCLFPTCRYNNFPFWKVDCRGHVKAKNE